VEFPPGPVSFVTPYHSRSSCTSCSAACRWSRSDPTEDDSRKPNSRALRAGTWTPCTCAVFASPTRRAVADRISSARRQAASSGPATIGRTDRLNRTVRPWRAAADRIWASSVRRALRDRAEIGLLDVRPEGRFAAGHPLFAASFPLGRLEAEVFDRLPRRSVPLVVYGNGDDAAAAVRRLWSLGYQDVSLLAGGLAGWTAAGGELFADVNAPSKAFGELVAATAGTPDVTARARTCGCSLLPPAWPGGSGRRPSAGMGPVTSARTDHGCC
jgi:rhodanese-related sulfurtransferase